MTKDQKKSIDRFKDTLTSFVSAGSLRLEKARLEAFLDAFPGEYCGWMDNGNLAYSKGFCKLLNIEVIHDIDDIQNGLLTSDAAALEGLFIRLQQEGKPFTLQVQTADNSKTLKLSGSRGHDLEQNIKYDILWLENISDYREKIEELETLAQEAEDERALIQAGLDHISLPLWMRNNRTEITWCNRAYAPMTRV